MNLRSILLCAAAVLVLPHAALAQSDARLKPSLTPFANDPMASKNPFKVRPFDIYRGEGGPVGTVGTTFAVSFMVQEMRSHLRPLAMRWNALDSDLRVYDVAVNVTGAELLKKVDATSQAKLDALSKSVGGTTIIDKLQAYRLVKSRQAIAAKAEAAALQQVWAAIADVDADAAVVHKQELLDEKASLEDRHKAIMAKVKSASWLKDAFSTAKTVLSKVSNPAKLGEYLMDKAVDATVGFAIDQIQDALLSNVLIQHAQELHDIDTRLKQVAAGITAASDETIKKRLAASQARLEAARIELVKAGIQRTVASVEGWDYIDALAQAERVHKKTDVFVTLQQYNREMRSVTKSMRANSADYLSILSAGQFSDAARVLTKVEAEVELVKTAERKSGDDALGEGSKFHPHLQQVYAVRNFTSHEADFYKHERKRMERYMNAVVAETHLDVVDVSVRQLLKSIGSTTEI